MPKNLPAANGAERTAPAPAVKSAVLQAAKIKDGVLQLIGEKAAFEELSSAFGSESEHFINYGLGQLINLMHDLEKEDCSFVVLQSIAQMKAFAPRNEAEAMLAIQAVCSHHAAQEMTRRTLRTNVLGHKNTYGNLATKFGRTFLAQVEGLAKLRRNGEQVVRHVHVNEGGQAVFAGTINQGGRKQ